MNRRAPQARGFTLVEVLVGATLAALVMVSLLAACLFLGRNFARLANQQALEEQARRALGYLRTDLALAKYVKPGTSPTSTSVTLVLPSGEVTYSYDAASLSLRRQSAAAANPDIQLLANGNCSCTAFALTYYTGAGGSPADQVTSSANVPYSIKQIQVSFSLATPAGQSEQTRAQYEAVSPRFVLRNKRPPDGT